MDLATRLVSSFPLWTTPAVPVPTRSIFLGPVLWIAPVSQPDSPLSADVECLKWQAYLALRGFTNVRIRTDIHPAGAINGHLPNLHAAEKTLLPAHHIPAWADEQTAPDSTPFEGYKDQHARDESHAWIALLEGTVHSALLLSRPPPSYLSSLLSVDPPKFDALQALLTPPPAPLTGFSSLFPPSGTRVSHSVVISQYADAISALSDRLGTDKWFLGSSGPTPLDALAFAYLHSAVTSNHSTLRLEVSRRVNLVAWEWRVRQVIRTTFVHHSP